ncbi:MAG: DUF4347 domain-containing protein [Spirulina sp. SIO3F2]|nr:DUF4347 domain-containing protein [Spirulina sp. SIO3F2]
MKTASALLKFMTPSAIATIILAIATTAQAQSITAAPDGTGTTITHNGNTYAIGGGTQAGANLFHSFQEFGLAPNEIADFLSNPNIQNVLGRVVGGNPSVIEGMIRLSGGASNLYLMNPAGIVFTSGASLDVPGSFAATTATRIGFNDGFFNAYGDNDYAALTGNPLSFVFDTETGTIFNDAMLEVPEGESLWLVGNSVLSTGTIAVENGNITIAAIPENHQIKIDHDGMILDLVLDAAPMGADDAIGGIGIKPTDLPRYLTGGNQQGNANTVVVNEDGQVYLTHGGDLTPFQTGDVGIAGSVEAETVQLMATDQVTPTDYELVQGDTTVVRFPGAGDPLALTAIDTTVAGYAQFLFGGKAGSISFTVDSDESGIAEISDRLTQISTSGQHVSEVHIVSEGNAGNFWLGSDFVAHNNLAQHADSLQTWNTALTETADILLYSCLTALGSGGEALMQGLATLTGADVAASTTLTGNAALGGDWVLERQTGQIEASLGFTPETLATYSGKLALFTVTNGNDAGTGSLRQAISDANGAAGADEIRFSGVTAVDLTSGELGITEELTITGGNSNVTVERNASAANFRIFNVTGGAETTFENVTIANGKTSDRGGGIQSNGAVNLINSTVTGNSSSDRGGGIYTNRAVTLTNSTISANSTNQYGGGVATRSQITGTDSTVTGNFSRRNGAGLYSRSGNITLTNSTVSSNSSNRHGGGVWARNRTITLTNSTVSGNSSRVSAAGMYSSKAYITNSVVSNNSSGDLGGGVYVTGTTTLTDSTIAGNISKNKGGGIYFRNHLTAENSTISGNVSNRGGGIYSRGGGTVTVTNSTISGNSTSDRGGGLFARGRSGGTITFFNSTIANNTANRDGGGIFRNASTVNLTNTIVATNVANRSGNDLSGTFNTVESSLIGDTAGATMTTSTNNLTNVEPHLLPLGDYGGSTQTHALAADSPARNAGNSELTLMVMDQRGVTRILEGAVDMGAVEYKIPEPTETSTNTNLFDSGAIADLLDDNEEPIVPLMAACQTVPEVTVENLEGESLEVEDQEKQEPEETVELDEKCQPLAA